MKSLKISLVAGIFLSIAIQTSGQLPWPLPAFNQQHFITGTYGECRFTEELIRFHQGVDMVNGTNYKVYAMRSGFLTIPGSSRVTITTSEGAKDSYIHVKGNSWQNNTFVTAGTLIGTMIQAKPIHLHLETRTNENHNALAHRISPYTDVTPPQINSFSIRQNGHSFYNATQEFPANYSFQNQQHRIIYHKVDFVANVRDMLAGTCAPSRLSFNVKDYQDISVSGGDVFNLNFEQQAWDAAAQYCFGPGSSLSPTTYNYVLTAHSRTQPYDRYFNTNLRSNVTETWTNTDIQDARTPAEARYPDGKYMIRVNVWDVDLDMQNNVNTQSFPVIFDNYLPYIQKVEMRKENANGGLHYRAMWTWNNLTMQFTKPVDLPMVNPVNVYIRVTTSEPMLDVWIQAGSYSGVLTTPVSGTNGKEWEFLLPASLFEEGENCLQFQGHDYAGNQLYGLSNTFSLSAMNFPQRQSNGNWNLYNSNHTDKVHCFRIQEPILPEAAFIPAEITINPGDAVHFTDLSANQPYQWDWAFDGGDPAWSSEQHPVVTYDNPGTYTVILFVLNDAGVSSCTGLVHVTEEVVPPIALFSPDYLSIVPGTSVNFTDLSTGNPTQWIWNFDGAAPPSFDQHPVITFDQSGTYEISLSVSNAAGISLATGSVEVSVYNDPLEVLCMANPFMGVIGTTVNISASVVNGSPPFHYFFDFGDGTYENATDFSAWWTQPHTYTQNGDYLVVVLITDSEGKSNSCQVMVTIYGGDPCSTLNPNFSAAGGNFSVAVTAPCTFTDLSSGGTQPYWYYWTFGNALTGDGTPSYTSSTDQNPMPVVYNATGNYPVTLHINDNAGCQASITKIVKVFLPEHCLVAKIGSGDENYTQLTPGPASFWDFSKLASSYACSSPPGSGVMPCETDAVWNLYMLPSENLVASKHTHPMDPATCAPTSVWEQYFSVNLVQPGKYLLRLNIWDNNCMVQSGYDCKDMDELTIQVIDCDAELEFCLVNLNTQEEDVVGKTIVIAGPGCTADFWYGAEKNYVANKEIRILEGFYAHEGSFFRADIQACQQNQQQFSAPAWSYQTPEEASLEVWPNPCMEKCFIRGLDQDKPYDVFLVDAVGREVEHIRLSGKDASISTLGKPAGNYNLVVRSIGESQVFRLTICNP